MSRYLIIGSAPILSYRWDIQHTELWRLGDYNPRYIEPRGLPELHLDLGPTRQISNIGLDLLRTHNQIYLAIDKGQEAVTLSSGLKELIAIHGKDAVAVALDEELQKL